MNSWRTGLIAGLIFGVIDIIPMFFMEIPDRTIAIIGAFINRFAIGFLIPNTNLPFSGWLKGLFLGLLLSLPDAIITGAYGPILGFGIVGGTIIGYAVDKKVHKAA